MTKAEKLVLAALASSGYPDQYSPVQTQKMFFLLDRNARDVSKGCFKFIPYHYGPYDPKVYEKLNRLAAKRFVQINGVGAGRRYVLTREGYDHGKNLLTEMQEQIQDYMAEVSDFVRRLSFTELVAAIYKDYPEMKVNSVFRD